MRIGVALLAGGSALTAGLLSVLLFAGCGETTFIDVGRMCTLDEARRWGCTQCPITCKKLDGGLDGEDGEDGATDAGEEADGGVACEGACVPHPGLSLQGPVLLWLGTKGQALACPEQAQTAQDWQTDLLAPPASCGDCTCDPPAGSCTLPTELTVSTATCAGSGSGAWFSPFDAPSGWDGSCTSMDAFAMGCNGGLCSKSLTIAPPAVTKGVCTPVSVGSAGPPAAPTWGTFARTCTETPHVQAEACVDPQQRCAPAPAPGFLLCAYQTGDVPCGSHYSERHVLYESYSDTRGCSPCACDDATGSSCTAQVSVFTGLLCSDLLGLFPIDTTGPKCFDLPPGTALASKSASPATYSPGVCQPDGGYPTGIAEPLFPTTFCCVPG
ncbi:MAG: hypothetical protein ABI193_01175 [Minicystis sp.]